MDKVKVLLITYYWPPSGGAGVQRWLKMSKHLANNQLDITVYSPDSPEVPALDHSLLKDIHPSIKELKLPIWEPYKLYSFLSRNKKSNHSNYLGGSNKSPIQKVSEWIRANIFIPDPRKYWINPSIKFLTKTLKKDPFDLIISSGPPHSMHLIALGLKKKFPSLKWIADFRDPWTFIDYFHLLPLSARSKQKHFNLEKSVINLADELITVSPSWAEDFQKLHGRKFNIVYNGYDESDFSEDSNPIIKQPEFTICHVGSLNTDRDPAQLWKYLEEKCLNDPVFNNALIIKLIGKVNPLTLNSLTSSEVLQDKLIHIDYLPHNKAIAEMKKSEVLLLLINKSPNAKGIIPGKIYEYLACQRKVLCISPIKNDCTTLLEEFNQVYISNEANIKNNIDVLFNEYAKQDATDFSLNFTKYSRKVQASKINQLIANLFLH